MAKLAIKNEKITAFGGINQFTSSPALNEHKKLYHILKFNVDELKKAGSSLLCTYQCRAQSTHLYGIDTCRAADGQTDPTLRERSKGHESSVSGVDTDSCAVLSTFNEEAAILHAEGHILRLMLTERGQQKSEYPFHNCICLVFSKRRFAERILIVSMMSIQFKVSKQICISD